MRSKPNDDRSETRREVERIEQNRRGDAKDKEKKWVSLYFELPTCEHYLSAWIGVVNHGRHVQPWRLP